MCLTGKHKNCFNCSKFPCARLRKLDERYRTKYGMSMIANLEEINAIGIDAFVKQERRRWACPQCGSLICVHRPNCLSCGQVWGGAE